MVQVDPFCEVFKNESFVEPCIVNVGICFEMQFFEFDNVTFIGEGRGTGFPTIYNAMAANGSPEPSFETDDNTYVLVTLPIHISDGASDGVNVQVFSSLLDVLAFCDGASDGASVGVRSILEAELHDKVEGLLSHAANWIKREDLFSSVGLSNHSTNRKKYLDPLINIGWIEMEYPDTPTHPGQRYRVTGAGKRLMGLLG